MSYRAIVSFESEINNVQYAASITNWEKRPCIKKDNNYSIVFTSNKPERVYFKIVLNNNDWKLLENYPKDNNGTAFTNNYVDLIPLNNNSKPLKSSQSGYAETFNNPKSNSKQSGYTEAFNNPNSNSKQFCYTAEINKLSNFLPYQRITQFAYFPEKLSKAIKELKELSLEEKWYFGNVDTGKCPILKIYFIYTFSRLVDEEQYSPNKKLVWSFQKTVIMLCLIPA